MAIIASSAGSSTPRTPIAQGAYPARCYSIIDLGTREEVILGNKKVVHKVRITFELPTETRVFSEDKGEQPCVISKEFSLSLNEKSTLRAFLKSWRGKDFTEEEAQAFDISRLIGVPCLLNIIHVAGKQNPSRMYDEIGSIMPLPKGMTCPDQVNPSFEFSIAEWDNDKFASMPTFLREKVASSNEYAALVAVGKVVAAAPAPAAPAPAPAPKPAPAPAKQAASPIDLSGDADELPF